MSPEAKHPHIERATEEQLTELLDSKSAEVRALYLEVHRLVLETLPDVSHSTDCVDGATGYGARQYGYDGWGMAALVAHSRWISLVFFRGTDLMDGASLLEGTGQRVRHVKLETLDQIEQQRNDLRALIQAAASLNER